MNKILSLTCIILASAGISCGGVIFSDNFSGANGQPDSLWNNEYNFVINNGTYNATAPNNNPLAITTIKNLAVADATIDLDILGSADGGVVLHSQGLASNGNMNCVLLVVVPNTNLIYWHVVHNGGDWTSYGVSSLSVGSGTDLHINIQITGSVYVANAYRLSDNQFAGTTTLNNSTYNSGGIGIYDYNGTQCFDNVVISTIPEPATVCLLAISAAGLLRKQK